MSMYILIPICGSNIRENMQDPGILASTPSPL